MNFDFQISRADCVIQMLKADQSFLSALINGQVTGVSFFIIFGEAKLHLSFLVRLRPDFTSKLVHVLAFGTPKFYIALYDKIKHELVNLSSNCDVKSVLSNSSKNVKICSAPDKGSVSEDNSEIIFLFLNKNIC